MDFIVVVVVVVGIIAIVFVVWLLLRTPPSPTAGAPPRSGAPSPPSSGAAARQVESQASEAVRQLAAARAQLDRTVADLERAVREDVRTANFRQLRDMHHASRVTADGWYQHKKDALAVRRRLSSGLERFREEKRQLARRRDQSSGARRLQLVHSSESVQFTIDAHYGLLQSIDEEIRRGSDRLLQFNVNTGSLRDFIRDNCGQQGRDWYRALEERKRQRGR